MKKIFISSAIAGGVSALLSIWLSALSVLTMVKSFAMAFIITFFAIAVVYGLKD